MWKKLDEKEALRVQSNEDPEKVSEDTAVAVVEVLPLSTYYNLALTYSQKFS